MQLASHPGDDHGAGDPSTVAAILAWALDALDLLSSAARPAAPAELRRLADEQGLASLPGCYAEFLAFAGAGGPGSLIHELFPGADVGIESLLQGEGWPGARGFAEEVLTAMGAPDPFEAGDVVIRVHRQGEVDWLRGSGPDPVVLGVRRLEGCVRVVAPSFTSWLERSAGRAIKRRYPLRDARFPGRVGEADAAVAGWVPAPAATWPELPPRPQRRAG